jgi:hypothetical protein
MGDYQTLLNIAVKHSFFTSGVCSCMNFVPTGQTRRVFENTGLLQKKTAAGIQVLYDRSRVEALKLYAADPLEPLCFDFKVYSTDPQFKSYSEPFADSQDGILYFDNRETTPGDSDIGLSSLGAVSVEDLMKSDSNEFNSVLGKTDRLLPPLLALRIFAETDKGSHLTHWLESEQATYTIAFETRKTRWKYYLLGSIAKPDTYIHDPDDQVDFEALGETSLPEQRVAFAFRSKQAIALHDYYDFRFQLKQQGLSGEYVLIQRLPVASIGQTGIEMIADRSTVVSEIYINN